jgi:hypothetical protein
MPLRALPLPQCLSAIYRQNRRLPAPVPAPVLRPIAETLAFVNSFQPVSSCGQHPLLRQVLDDSMLWGDIDRFINLAGHPFQLLIVSIGLFLAQRFITRCLNAGGPLGMQTARIFQEEAGRMP